MPNTTTTYNKHYNTNDLDFTRQKNDTDSFNWLIILFIFFITTGISLFIIVKRFKSNAVHPKQVKLKYAKNPIDTTEHIQNDLNNIRKEVEKDRKKKSEIMDKERYKLFLKRRYPNVDFEMADQFYKNRKLMATVKEKIKTSKLKKIKKEKTIKIREIPTERVDLMTAIKEEKVKPKFDTVASLRVKNDRILKMMREKKIVRNNKFKK